VRRINVRREELNVLGWPKARKTLAKEPGISDIGVERSCRHVNATNFREGVRFFAGA
jgi:hypothetical protein